MEDGHGSAKCTVVKFKNLDDFKLAVVQFLQEEFIGIAAMDGKKITPVSGTVKDFSDFFLIIG